MQKNKRLYRIFVNHNFENGALLCLLDAQAHYLKSVLRKRSGDELLVFNGSQEWLAVIEVDKNKIRLIEQTRILKEQKSLTLIFGLIKNNRIDLIFEKGTELGVTNFMPITSQYSMVDKLSISKAENWVMEAAEQSGRIDLPKISSPMSLNKLIGCWPEEKKIIYCDEDEGEKKIGKYQGDLAILIGPEGGFSPEERSYLRSKNFVYPVSLGKNILRAETAVICAISQMLLLW